MAKFEVYRDRNYEFRWRLKADNGQIIADSAEGYTSRANCEYGIGLVKRQASLAIIEDQT